MSAVRGARRWALVVVLAVLGVVAACGQSTPDLSGPPVTLRVLAGTELADMAPVLDRAAAATNVHVQMRYTGSRTGAREVSSGQDDGAIDAVWFASNRYLDLDGRNRGRLGTATTIMTSPVVLGLKRSVVDRLGWTGRPVSWADISQAAGAGKFTFGMTDPTESNSAVSGLVGVAAAADATGRALDQQGVQRATPALTAFFGAQTMTAGSSGYLNDAFVDRATGRVPGPPVDGLVTYEASLQSLDRSGRLPDPLVPIYPTDGAVSADYPLTTLTTISPEARDGYTRLTAWLRSSEGQQAIADTTQRRPGRGLPATPRPDQPPVIELPFPGTEATLDSLVGAYFQQFRRPARTVYVLDVSGSMGDPVPGGTGTRIAALQAALTSLTSADPTSVPVRAREDLTLLPFSDTPQAPQQFVVDPAAPDVARNGLRAAATALAPNGNTALYDALIAAYRDLEAQPPANPQPITSIVLMTDGENTSGSSPEALDQFLGGLPPAMRGIPVFTVLFGEAAVGPMTDIATRTGGKVFDARTTPLPDIIQQIRGYQ